MHRWVAGLMIVAMVCGCGKRQSEQAPGISVRSGDRSNRVYQEVTEARRVKTGDDLQVTVDVVQVTAPAGSLSELPALWEVVDQHAFSSGLQRQMNINGVRVGVMSAGSWDDAKKVLELAPDVLSQTATLAGKSRVSLNAQKAMQETLFYFDRNMSLQGRTFESVENFWGVHFAPDPARPGSISMEVAPVVRSIRRQMRMKKTGEDYEIEYEQPETVLDLAIRTSLPVGTVLVIAPSKAASESSSSIGRAFLLDDQAAGLTEQIFFLYPRLYRLDERASER